MFIVKARKYMYVLLLVYFFISLLKTLSFPTVKIQVCHSLVTKLATKDILLAAPLSMDAIQVTPCMEAAC